MKVISRWLHAHIYFDEGTRSEAERFQTEIATALSGKARIHRLIDRPIGPHPKPMFEVDFPAEHYDEVTGFLRTHRGELGILVHQVSEDEVWDHTEGAEWMGPKLELNIQFLRDFMAGKVSPIGKTIRRDQDD